MKHYLTAEWGRAVARPYFRAFLLVLLALAAAGLVVALMLMFALFALRRCLRQRAEAAS